MYGQDRIVPARNWFTLLVQGLTTKLLLKKLNLLEEQSLREQFLQLIARRDALQHVSDYLIQTQHQLTIIPALHQAQLDFVKQQIQQLHIDIAHMQNQHLQLQAFSITQHQEKLLLLESEIYTKFVQAGLLKNSLTPIMHKAFEH